MEELQKQIAEIESQIEKLNEENYEKVLPLETKAYHLKETMEQLGLVSIEKDIPAITAKLKRVAKYIRTIKHECDMSSFIISDYAFKKSNKDESFYNSAPFDIVISEVDGHEDYVEHSTPLVRVEILFVYQKTAVKNFIDKWWQKNMKEFIQDEEYSKLKVLKDVKTDL